MDRINATPVPNVPTEGEPNVVPNQDQMAGSTALGNTANATPVGLTQQETP